MLAGAATIYLAFDILTYLAAFAAFIALLISFVFGLCAYEMFYKRLICIIINIVCKYKVLFYTLD